MSIDYAAIYSALYDRAATDSDGAAVRALLGSPSSVFPADQLGNVAGVVLPWLVWRAGQVNNSSGEMRDTGASWWAYAAPNKGDRPLHQLATELEILYGARSRFEIDGGRLLVTFISQPREDEALGLRGMEIRIGFRRLG